MYDSKTGKMLAITDLSTQDPKHKGKRLDMPSQSSAKTMLIDKYCASAIDLFLVRNYFDDEQVRNLRTSDLRRDDRQNFAAVVRRNIICITWDGKLPQSKTRVPSMDSVYGMC